MIDLDDSRRSAIGALDGSAGPAPDASDRAIVHALVYLGDCIRGHDSYDPAVESALRSIASDVGGISTAIQDAGTSFGNTQAAA